MELLKQDCIITEFSGANLTFAIRSFMSSQSGSSAVSAFPLNLNG
jgi:hypothetical protein